jgi:hypothetical protein
MMSDEWEYITRDALERIADVIAGQSYTLSVKMLNTGSNTWTAANHYNLGSANDNGAGILYPKSFEARKTGSAGALARSER